MPLVPLDSIHHKLSKKSHTYTPGVCSLGKPVSNSPNILYVYNEVKKEFNSLIDQSTPFQRANIFGSCLRLAFHDAGEVNLNTADKFGPDGCLSNSGANSGLLEPETVTMSIIEPLWQKYCNKITRADFWAMMGKLAAEKADPTQTLNIPYHYGRKDNLDCDGGQGRLPDAQIGTQEFQRVFIEQMKLTLHDAVTLLGAHSLGHVHTEYSGFGKEFSNEHLEEFYNDNSWDDTPDQFDSLYYTSMLDDPWVNVQSSNNPKKNTWFVPKDPTDPDAPETVMLNADMVIGFNAHSNYNATVGAFTGVDGELCSRTAVDIGDNFGCKSGLYGEASGHPNTYELANAYAQDNAKFLSAFADAYVKMVTVGYGILRGAAKNNKLGWLTPIDLGKYFDSIHSDQHESNESEEDKH